MNTPEYSIDGELAILMREMIYAYNIDDQKKRGRKNSGYQLNRFIVI